MEIYQYQKGFSEKHTNLYDLKARQQKAKKILSVLTDYFKSSLANLTFLDVGSSTGIMTHLLSHEFKQTTGIDIDEKAVAYSQKEFENEKLEFHLQDSMDIKYPDNTFDVVNCSHIYEHVPDSKRLMDEIYRVLKPGGVCFFAAGNRLILMEQHYHLPLLSVVPKFVAHKYVKLMGKADFYYETHLTYWGLKKLTSAFEVIDYTLEIIRHPKKYYATEMIKENSFSQKFYLSILRGAYFLCPTYLWLLKKPQEK